MPKIVNWIFSITLRSLTHGEKKWWDAAYEVRSAARFYFLLNTFTIFGLITFPFISYHSNNVLAILLALSLINFASEYLIGFKYLESVDRYNRAQSILLYVLYVLISFTGFLFTSFIVFIQ
jgi:hypothetical protein